MSDFFNGEPYRLIIDEDDPVDIKFGNSGLDDAKYVRTLSLNRASFKIVYRSSEAPFDETYQGLQIYFRYNGTDNWQLVYSHPWIAINDYTGEGVEVETIESIEEPDDGTIYKPQGPTFKDIKRFDYNDTNNYHINDSKVYYYDHMAQYKTAYVSGGVTRTTTHNIAYLYKEISNNKLTYDQVKQILGRAGLEQFRIYSLNIGSSQSPDYKQYYKYSNNVYNNGSLINNIDLSIPDIPNTYEITDLETLPVDWERYEEYEWSQNPSMISSETRTDYFYRVSIETVQVTELPDNPDEEKVYYQNSKWWHYNGYSWDEVQGYKQGSIILGFRFWYHNGEEWIPLDMPNTIYHIKTNTNITDLCFNSRGALQVYTSTLSYSFAHFIEYPTEGYDKDITDENDPYMYPKFKTITYNTPVQEFNEITLDNLPTDEKYYITLPISPDNDTTESDIIYPLKECYSYFCGVISSYIVRKLINDLSIVIPEEDYSYIWSKKYEMNFIPTNDTQIQKDYNFLAVINSLSHYKFSTNVTEENRYVELSNNEFTIKNELYMPVDTVYSVTVDIPEEFQDTYKIDTNYTYNWSGTVSNTINNSFHITYANEPIYLDTTSVNSTKVHYLKRSSDDETDIILSNNITLDFKYKDNYYDDHVTAISTQGYYNRVTVKKLMSTNVYSKDYILYEGAKLTYSDESYSSFEDAEILLDTSFTLDAQEEILYLLYTNATTVILSKNDDEFELSLSQTSVLLFSDTQYDAYLYCYAIIENNYIIGLRFILDAEQYHHSDSYDIRVPNAFGKVPGEHWIINSSLIRPTQERITTGYINVDPVNNDIAIDLSTENKYKAVDLYVVIPIYDKIFELFNDSDSQHHLLYKQDDEHILYYYVECDQDGFLTTLHFYGSFDDDQGIFTFEPSILIR